ncbi:DUF3341 domain-containing protein [Bradymonas sediminis]|uniref:DUF3341 domain-containing protein n=1 Tax=Bradymonas sediminis TaxID=1548548 RepID=UPI0010D7BA3F|nr:DUF3341 domain-containing protein [Bradymonas sediminis]TDP75894.1 uncharacterized protein DUF3341 [Bradymonas sediminis]
MVDKKKDKAVNEEENQTPEEESEQIPGADGTIESEKKDAKEETANEEESSEEAASDEDAAEEKTAEEEVAAEEEAVEEEPVAVAATVVSGDDVSADRVQGVAALFDHPKHLMAAAELTRDSKYEAFDAFSPFPIHGMDDAMGLGRSWIPWVTTAAALTGFCLATAMQFGMMTYDWPLIIGGKAFAPWPSFVPVMFELSVLLAGTSTVGVMFKAAGCFKKPVIIDPRITDDLFALWISADDENFELNEAIEFLEKMNPLEVRKVAKDA